MKAFLLILAFCVGCCAQNLDDFIFIGTSDGPPKFAYFINPHRIIRDGDNVKFLGLMGVFQGYESKQAVVDQNNYVITEFRGQCSQNFFSRLKTVGVWGGRKVNIEHKPEVIKAEKTSPLAAAIDMVCSISKSKDLDAE